MADRHILMCQIRDHGNTLIEYFDNLIIKAEFTLVDQHADGQCRNTLALGVGDMPQTQIICAKGSLGNHSTVTQDHEAMGIKCLIVFEIGNKPGDIVGRNAFCLRCCPGKWLGHGSRTGTDRFLGNRSDTWIRTVFTVKYLPDQQKCIPMCS